MASRATAPRLISISRAVTAPYISARSFQTSRTLLQEVAAVPVKRPVGAFRGGLFGFLLGSTLAGATTYYYILDEYKASNEMLNEDIHALQNAVRRLHDHVVMLENIDLQESSKK